VVFHGSFSGIVEIDQAGRQKFAPRHHDLQCIYSASSSLSFSQVVKYPSVLSVPFVRTSFGARSFNVAAPKIWNSLPPANMYQSQHVVISRLTISTRPSNPLSDFLLVFEIRLLLTTMRVYKLYLLTCILSHRSVVPAIIKSVKTVALTHSSSISVV